MSYGQYVDCLTPILKQNAMGEFAPNAIMYRTEFFVRILRCRLGISDMDQNFERCRIDYFGASSGDWCSSP